MDTKIITCLPGSSNDASTIDALRITDDRLSSDYAHRPAQRLVVEGRAWLHRITATLDR